MTEADNETHLDTRRLKGHDQYMDLALWEDKSRYGQYWDHWESMKVAIESKLYFSSVITALTVVTQKSVLFFGYSDG